MKNFIKPGKVLTMIAPAGGVTSGELVFIGSIFGIAATSAAEGEEFELSTGGVWELPKTAAEAWTVGAKVYWDATNAVATSADGAGANKQIGVATAVAANPSGIGDVRLNSNF
jgi:predicted RecA/RadA family phage recombinase